MVAQVGNPPFGATNATIPGQDGFAVTPSDVTNFDSMARALYVGTGGDVTLLTTKGTVLTFVSVQAGSVLPIMAVRVNLTNTTAQDIIGIL